MANAPRSRGSLKTGQTRRTSSSNRKTSSTTSKTTRGNGGKRSSSRQTSTVSSRNSSSKMNPEIKEDIITLLLFAFFVFVLLCMINVIKGIIGEGVKHIMLGIFGLLGYLIPFCCLLGFLFKLSNKRNPFATLKLVSGIVLLADLGIIICLSSGFDIASASENGDLLTSLYDSQEKAGIVFGLLAVLLNKAVGKFGSWFICILLVIICILIIADKSFVKNLLSGNVFSFNNFDDEYDYYEEDDGQYNLENDKKNRKLSREDILRRDEFLRQQEKERKRKEYEEYLENERAKNRKNVSKEDFKGLEEHIEDGLNSLANTRPVVKISANKNAAMALPDKQSKIAERNMKLEEKRRIQEEKERLKDLKDDQRILNTTIKGNDNYFNSYETEVKNENLLMLEEKKKVNKNIIHEITFDAEDYADSKDSNLTNIEKNNSSDNIHNEEVIPINRLDYSDDLANTQELLYNDSENDFDSISFEKKIIDNTLNESENEDNHFDNSSNEDSFDEPILDKQNNDFDEFNNEKLASESNANDDTFEDELIDVSDMPEPITSKSHEGNEVTGKADLDDEKIRPIHKEYVYPTFDLLNKNKNADSGDSDDELKSTALKLKKCLKTFGVDVEISDISQGPSVTRYELTLAEGTKVSKIVNLQDDIKLNLAAQDIRIEAPIPGKAAVGIEIPNKNTSSVLIRDLLETKEFDQSESKITFAVGKDISGKTIVADIAKMPHMLIAGATGAGKSVCINTLIMSVLYKANPKDVKLIMIDPKVVELSVYNGIPHLLLPVVTDPKKASAALMWAVNEMTKRYNDFATYNVRDLKGFNQKAKAMNDNGDFSKKPKPQIIVIVDELADLMMVASKEVEESICRLAQLARAAGIHLIIATQRPSVDVITGLIKANMPSRVAFRVSSGVDSRTILDMVGAEKLLGKGDMLFYPQGYSKPLRVQGAFVSDEEVSSVVEFLKENAGDNVYDKEVEEQISGISTGQAPSSGQNTEKSNDLDPYFEEACRLVIEKEKASSGMLQRVYKIGFNRAARIIDQMESLGIVGPEEGTKPRRVLMSMSEFDMLLEEIY